MVTFLSSSRALAIETMLITSDGGAIGHVLRKETAAGHWTVGRKEKKRAPGVELLRNS